MSVFQVNLTQGVGRAGQGALDTFAAKVGGVISAASWSATNNGTITFTTSAPHGLAANLNVTVAGVDPDGYNGTYVVQTVPTTTTFTVLNTSNPGSYVSDGVVNGSSLQRGVWIPGPNRKNRLLIDGQTFSDCNYWKRFAQPALPAESAFITVITDDGSPYSDNAEENLYPVAYNGNDHDGFTVSHTTNDSIDDAYVVDILGDTGNYAVFTQIEVVDEDVYCRINGQAIIKISAGAVQTFDRNDLPVGKLEFYVTGSTDATVSVVGSVLVTCNS